MKWKVAAVVALLVVGLGTTGLVILAPGANNGGQPQYLTSTVRRANVTQQVVATGSLRSAAIFDLAFGADPTLATDAGATGTGASGVSWLVTSVSVAVGDSVTKGDVLATADTGNAKAALDVAKANLAVAKARLAVDSAGLTGARRSAAYDSIRQAQQQLKVATQSQAQTAAQNALRLSQAQAALAQAQQQAADSQASWSTSPTIVADQAAVTQAQQQLDTLNLQISGSNTLASVASQQDAFNLAQAQAALAAAQQKLAADLAADPGAISADQAAVTQAQQKYDALNLQIQATNTQTSVTGQQNALKLSQAQAALATAQKKLADDLAAGLPAATVKANQAAIDQAQQQLDTLQLSIAASDGSAANQLASAQLSLSSSRTNYSIQVAPADPSTIATDKASVVTAQSGVTAAQYSFDRSKLTSPVDGVVTAVNIATGATAPASAAVTVASRQMEVSATVTESDYPSLKLGQTVDVAIVALGQTVTGTVKQIVPTGTLSNGVVTYPIIVTLDPTSGGAASGMSADIQVTTAQASNVLAVPAEALNGSNGSYSVRVLGSDGVVTAQTVQVGLVTSSLAEITGGLTEGQTVVTGISTPQTGEATTTNGGLGGGFEGGGVDLPGGGGGGGGHAPGGGGGG